MERNMRCEITGSITDRIRAKAGIYQIIETIGMPPSYYRVAAESYTKKENLGDLSSAQRAVSGADLVSIRLQDVQGLNRLLRGTVKAANGMFKLSDGLLVTRSELQPIAAEPPSVDDWAAIAYARKRAETEADTTAQIEVTSSGGTSRGPQTSLLAVKHPEHSGISQSLVSRQRLFVSHTISQGATSDNKSRVLARNITRRKAMCQDVNPEAQSSQPTKLGLYFNHSGRNCGVSHDSL
jgi:hypothetical protein